MGMIRTPWVAEQPLRRVRNETISFFAWVLCRLVDVMKRATVMAAQEEWRRGRFPSMGFGRTAAEVPNWRLRREDEKAKELQDELNKDAKKHGSESIYEACSKS